MTHDEAAKILRRKAFVAPLSADPKERAAREAFEMGAQALEEHEWMLKRMKCLQRDVGERDEALRKLSTEMVHKTAVQNLEAMVERLKGKLESISCLLTEGPEMLTREGLSQALVQEVRSALRTIGNQVKSERENKNNG